MAPSPLVAALLCVLALTAVAPATAGPAESIIDLFWDTVLHQNCQSYAVNAVLATYADGEETFKYGIYSRDVKMDFHPGPKLEYLKDRTKLHRGGWCDSDKTPQYIEPNSVQEFSTGDTSKFTFGSSEADFYFRVFDKANNPTNCILKMYLTSGSFLRKESGCEAYPNLQILSFRRVDSVDRSTSSYVDGNAFWVYWNDQKTAHPAGFEMSAMSPSAAPSSSMKNTTETDAVPEKPAEATSPAKTSAGVMLPSFNLAYMAVLISSIIAAYIA